MTSLWYSIKMSISGARLSHLVQKDAIWDHGSMVEQVRALYLQLEKARTKGDGDTLKKYTTSRGFERLCRLLDQWRTTETGLAEVCIIEVHPSHHNRPDCFCARVGLRFSGPEPGSSQKPVMKYFRWKFLRQGEWWLLDG